MTKFYSDMTVEEAISCFPIGSTEVEVLDDSEDFIGFLTIEALSVAVQQSDLTKPISHFITVNAPLQNLRNYSIPYEQFQAFFESDLCRVVFNALYDGVYITDGDGTTLFINQAYQRITGIREEEIIGKPMSYLIEQGMISVSASLDSIRTKNQVTLTQRIRNGRKIIVSATPILSPQNEVIFVINSVRDITELIRMKYTIDSQKLSFQPISQLLPGSEQVNLQEIIIGPSTTPLFKLADKVAKTDAKILLQGETGVGKSLIAKYIHAKSSRKEKIFLELNCGAIPANLVESELFGYEPGAFTGSLKNGKMGIFEKVNGGTLFLDEIGDLPLELQVKLLKVVEENKFMRVGSTEMKEVDVRLITATHRDLASLVQEGSFREDLYYRLNIVSFEIPPLRQRKEETIPLLEMYLKKFNEKYNEKKKMTPECYEWLTNYSWPGNIRELASLAERLVVTTYDDTIDLPNLPSFIQPVLSRKTTTHSLKEAVSELERSLILNAMKKYGTTRAAAISLDISQSALVQKMKKFHIRLENESN